MLGHRHPRVMEAMRRQMDREITEHRKVERRINEYPMTDEELEFIKAVNEYKQLYNKPFPTWSEILHILKSIGYEKKSQSISCVRAGSTWRGLRRLTWTTWRPVWRRPWLIER